MSAEHEYPGGEPPRESARSAPTPRSADEIQQWMIDYLARALERPSEEIDVTAPFDEFALDSATAIGMTGELEEWLGKRVDPTLVYDYPTIEQFSQCVADAS
jgi:acyl carrier protein